MRVGGLGQPDTDDLGKVGRMVTGGRCLVNALIVVVALAAAIGSAST